MQILLTNDDGIYAPGLAALHHELSQLGEVSVVAPATEQSGVGHSVTFLSPLVCHEVFNGDQRRGWAVEGSPADCVKIGLFELCEKRPDLVVSGINGGLNAGINVLYSGTVAAAIEGAFFGITSMAVSLEYDEHANFTDAAKIGRSVIEQVLAQKGDQPQLYNLNIPTSALRPASNANPSETPSPVVTAADICTVPMGVQRYGEHFIKRIDPRGRTYYWATNDPPPKPGEHETDLTALQQGKITLTPLSFSMTDQPALEEMNQWKLELP